MLNPSCNASLKKEDNANLRDVHPTKWRRHARVWVERSCKESDLRSGTGCWESQEDGLRMLAAHIDRGHPFVLRRRQSCDGIDRLPLGLRLPREAKYRSLSFSVPYSRIDRIEDALSLKNALSDCVDLPPIWRDALQELEQRAQDIEMTLRVYGSLAWQSVTGVRYLASDSDIDFLLRPVSLKQAEQALALLAASSNAASFRLDGEIEFPDGRAVAWKEMLGSSKQVLVKDHDSVDLVLKESLWNQPAWT